jgi:4'-phosphopantetheinyl transferase
VFYARPACVLSQVARAALEARLSDDERARLARFAAPADAELYLVAHALTRCVLARYLGSRPERLAFESGERGRPELAGPERASGLRFNLSHTRGLAACGVSLHAAIGVDVEHQSRRVELDAVGKRVFSSHERAGLAGLQPDAQRQRFFDLWTLKEAYVKATGKGLASPLTGVTFTPELCDPVPVRFEPPDADRPEDWCMRRLGLPPEHRLAVALQLPAARFNWQELNGSFFAG